MQQNIIGVNVSLQQINDEVFLSSSDVVNIKTYPQGERGYGIKSVTQSGNVLTVTFDDGTQQTLDMLDWWFGSADEYNALSDESKNQKSLYFIEEDEQ